MSNLRVGYSAKFFKHIPSDWGLIELKKLVKPDRKITYGIVQPGQYDPNGILLIRGQDYMTGWAERGSFFKVSPALHQKFKRSTTRSGDVLISIAGYTGTVAVVPSWIQEANLTQTTARICCKPDLMDGLYLSYFLQSDDGKLQSKRYTKGSAQEGLNLEDVEKFLISVPPLPEQQKIATILSSVDDVIEKTRAQIDKLKDLKTGMMQELLTKGIGHTEFKDSPVGRIPKGWDVGTLDSFCVSVLDGDRGKEYPKEKDFHSFEYCLFLSAKNVTKKGFAFSERSFITKEKDGLLRKGKLTRGDIVITTRGTVGNIAFYDNEVAFDNIRINSGMAIIRNSSTVLDSQFLHLLMNSPMVSEQVELLAFGSAQPQLTIGIIKNLDVPKPRLEEQQAITSAVTAMTTKLQLVNKKLNLLLSTKKALMQDLLTGKVRVTTKKEVLQDVE